MLHQNFFAFRMAQRKMHLACNLEVVFISERDDFFALLIRNSISMKHAHQLFSSCMLVRATMRFITLWPITHDHFRAAVRRVIGFLAFATVRMPDVVRVALLKVVNAHRLGEFGFPVQ